MTAAVDKWPTAARLVAVAAAGSYPQLLHHSKGHNHNANRLKTRPAKHRNSRMLALAL
jgi:hypothetical protein